jgi:hypothetical protein
MVNVTGLQSSIHSSSKVKPPASTTDMKSFSKLTLAAILALGFTLPSFALSFSDSDGSPTWLSASDSSSSNNSVSGWLNITTGNSPNYNPLTMTLTSATIKFAFADTYEPGKNWNGYDESDSGPGNDSQYREYVSIKLDTLNFLSGVEVDGTHAAYDWTSASGALSGSFFSALEVDGKINYKVTITSGDVWFKGAKITATGDYKSVPDAGSTVALMGMGLLGLAALKHRR